MEGTQTDTVQSNAVTVKLQKWRHAEQSAKNFLHTSSGFKGKLFHSKPVKTSFFLIFLHISTSHPTDSLQQLKSAIAAVMGSAAFQMLNKCRHTIYCTSQNSSTEATLQCCESLKIHTVWALLTKLQKKKNCDWSSLYILLGNQLAPGCELHCFEPL